MQSVAALIFVGIIGGLGANFLARLFWNIYTRPVLHIEEEISEYYQYDDGELQFAYYGVRVTNTGKTPAKNCKAEIHFRGSNDGQVFQLNGQLCWSESNYPTRLTINPKETATIEFVRMNTSMGGIMQFSNRSGWEEPSQILFGYTGEPEPIKQHWVGSNTDTDGARGVNQRDLIEASWDTNTVEISSENAGKVEGIPVYRYPEESGDPGLRISINQSSRDPIYPSLSGRR